MTTKTLTLEAFLEERTCETDANIAPEDYREPDLVLEALNCHVIPGDGDVPALGGNRDPNWQCGFYLQEPRAERNAKLGEFFKRCWREGRMVSFIAVARDVRPKKGQEGIIL